MPQSDQAFNEQNMKEFLTSGGKVAMFAKMNSEILLLHTTGAKSGKERINPLAYFSYNNRLFIFASDSGEPRHPSWYHNLLANPNVTVEIGTETHAAQAVVIRGADRDMIFRISSETFPIFTEYQKKAGSRAIPVVELLLKG